MCSVNATLSAFALPCKSPDTCSYSPMCTKGFDWRGTTHHVTIPQTVTLLLQFLWCYSESSNSVTIVTTPPNRQSPVSMMLVMTWPYHTQNPLHSVMFLWCENISVCCELNSVLCELDYVFCVAISVFLQTECGTESCLVEMLEPIYLCPELLPAKL